MRFWRVSRGVRSFGARRDDGGGVFLGRILSSRSQIVLHSRGRYQEVETDKSGPGRREIGRLHSRTVGRSQTVV